MVLIIFKCFMGVFVGVTIFTAVHTGIIGADIAAFYTMAALPHAFMLQISEHDAVRFAQNIKRRTAGGMNPIRGKISVCSAGLNKIPYFSAIEPSPCASVSISCPDKGIISGILTSSFLYISTKLKMQRSM